MKENNNKQNQAIIKRLYPTKKEATQMNLYKTELNEINYFTIC